MPYKRIIEMTDEQLESFAKRYGWTEKVIDNDGKEVVNPLSAEDVISRAIEEYLNNTIYIYKKRVYDKSIKEEIEALKPDIKLK